VILLNLQHRHVKVVADDHALIHVTGESLHSGTSSGGEGRASARETTDESVITGADILTQAAPDSKQQP
jgi:hypothetical protein